MSKELSVTQPTAWFMLGRLREACSGDLGKLSGVVEVDETFVGGKSKNMHKSKRLYAGRGTVGKIPVVGARQRNGKVKAKPVPERTPQAFRVSSPIPWNPVRPYTQTITRPTGACRTLTTGRSSTVSASTCKAPAHTNSVESVWAVLKRSVYGTWHHVSDKHLARYVDEAAFRLNEGNCKVHTLVRMDSFVRQAFQHRITYRELTA